MCAGVAETKTRHFIALALRTKERVLAKSIPSIFTINPAGTQRAVTDATYAGPYSMWSVFIHLPVGTTVLYGVQSLP